MTLYKKNILHNQNKNSSQLVSDIPLGCVQCTNNMYKQHVQTTNNRTSKKRKKKKEIQTKTKTKRKGEAGVCTNLIENSKINNTK